MERMSGSTFYVHIYSKLCNNKAIADCGQTGQIVKSIKSCKSTTHRHTACQQTTERSTNQGPARAEKKAAQPITHFAGKGTHILALA